MKKIFTVLIIIVIISCTQPLANIITETQQNSIERILESITVEGYKEKLSLFTNPRHVLIDPDEIIRVENAIIQYLSDWYGSDSVKTETLHLESVYELDDSGNYTPHKGDYEMRNIIATKVGNSPELRPVLISAHHDTVSIAPGTNDNGTGCAAVLEAAYQLKDISFERTIIFAFFGFEEEEVMVGSEYYLSGLSIEEYPESVINVDTIGYTSFKQNLLPAGDVLHSMPTTGDFIGAFGSTESKELLLDFLTAIDKDVDSLPVWALCMDDNFGSNIVLKVLKRSDHASFWFKGIPALMITDTAELREGNVYHTADDNWDHVDFEFATKVVKATISTLCRRAGIL